MNQAELNQLKALVDSIKPETEVFKVVPYTRSPELLTRLVKNRGSWDLTRTATKVKFGCGLVTVDKADLKTLADLKELEPKFKALQAVFDKLSAKKPAAVKRLVNAWQNSHHRVTPAIIEKIPVEVLKGLIG